MPSAGSLLPWVTSLQTNCSELVDVGLRKPSGPAEGAAQNRVEARQQRARAAGAGEVVLERR